ncbi:cellulase-like family protein [Herbiconiux sp. SYSU D00978]|uniref:cellulase-like family protein n=1 Tax=Herbiconiux sp. SYSU D00978 TaxID=2812562 RepID=UPI001A97215A|nr:cellulase-like family protein [Herbiconiux sp. SYSU D00978]
MSERRWLGTGAEPEAASAELTGPVPDRLPNRLAICLWDFSWYTRAEPGGPYSSLEDAFEATVARGYNAVRICAAPLLLFGDGADDATIEVEGLGVAPDGGIYGRGTRWYDVPGGYRLDLRERLFQLVETAARHDVVVILASWEYQQSPAFARDRGWFDRIDATPLGSRFSALARAFDRMLSALDERGLSQHIAFTELHNEIDFSVLPALDEAALADLARLRNAHPDQLVTVSYGRPPFADMAAVPGQLDVGQFHVYTYGVLDALQRRIDIRSEGSEGFPNRQLRELLQPDAPSPEGYGKPAPWKLEATVITDQMIYGYDWVDPDRWDLWLYDNYAVYREAMHREIASRVRAIAAWGRRNARPVVIGEGWVGYTPLHGGFEEGPVGKDLAASGIRSALEQGVWGMVPSSNAAPHHPMFLDAAWQRRINDEIRSA